MVKNVAKIVKQFKKMKILDRIDRIRSNPVNPVIVSDSARLPGADVVVIPGVGSFGDGMNNLRPFGDKLFDVINYGIPMLGICIGMHVHSMAKGNLQV